MKTVTRSVFAGAGFLTALMCMAVASQNTAYAIPITVCGTTLNVPGGQYELTGHLTCAAAPAVQIGASGISLDFKSFWILGSGFGSGIITASGHSSKAVTDVSILNGTVSRFAERIDLCAPYVAGGTVMHARVAGVKLIRNVDGIRVFNSNATASRRTISQRIVESA